MKTTAAGVATHSSGNHGAALARAAGARGIGATVIMPRDASQAKKDAVIAYGATLLECEPSRRSREDSMQRRVQETGCEAIPPFACMLQNPDRFEGKRVGIIISGGNVDLDRLPWCCMSEYCRWNRA